MRKSTADEKILSYNDVVLRRSDLDILSGPYFLNDRLLEFYFTYLSSSYPSEDILLVTPSIAFWIMNCPDSDSLKDFLEPLNLSNKKLIIFPVNDNDDVTKVEGGSHWSLLAYERYTNTYVHHDSNGGMNSRHAKRLFKVVVGSMETTEMSSNGRYVECSSTPQQMNGYDCGLFVAAIARAVCQWYVSGGPKDDEGVWFSAVNEEVSSSVVKELRSEILGLIRSLMAMK